MSDVEEKSGAESGGLVRRRRRRWSEAQKRQIVAETHEPGVSVPMVAQRYNVNANQVFAWRRLFREPARDTGIDGFVPVVACTVALKPLHDLIAAYVLAASRLHGDDTTVPVLAKGKTDTARAWVYVRDDAPFAGRTRRRRCSATRTRATVPAITRSSICRASPGSFRPMPTPDTSGSTSLADRRDL